MDALEDRVLDGNIVTFAKSPRLNEASAPDHSPVRGTELAPSFEDVFLRVHETFVICSCGFLAQQFPVFEFTRFHPSKKR